MFIKIYRVITNSLEFQIARIIDNLEQVQVANEHKSNGHEYFNYIKNQKSYSDEQMV